jgi:hypothetical protein
VAVVHTSKVPLTGPTAHRLADLTGVERDLQWVIAACAELVRKDSRYAKDDLAREALHDAALIRYGRCFKEGRRDAFQIPRSWIDELPAELRATHEEALSVRDKHIAHSVNDWEINVPVADIARVPEYGAATVRAVSVSHSRVVSLGTRGLQLLHDLAKALVHRVIKVGFEVQAELLREARSVAPRELELRAPEFPEAGRRKVGKDRRRPR